VYHEVGPDEQNARGPVEAMSDFGKKSAVAKLEECSTR